MHHRHNFFRSIDEGDIVDWKSLKRRSQDDSSAEKTPPKPKSEAEGDENLTPNFAANASFNQRIGLWRGDITLLNTDSIVAAANERLAGCWSRGHCIDAAIFSAAGIELFEECASLGGCKTGEAKITKAYKLPSKHVIHTVGPLVDADEGMADHQPEELASCYRSVLELVSKHQLDSVAFCCISTGVFGFDKSLAANIALGTVRHWLEKQVSAATSSEKKSDSDKKELSASGSSKPAATIEPINRESTSSPSSSLVPNLILFNVFTEEDYRIYRELLPVYFPLK